MSDEQGHPQGMPDPGTPFPMVGSGSATLERTGGVTGGITLISDEQGKEATHTYVVKDKNGSASDALANQLKAFWDAMPSQQHITCTWAWSDPQDPQKNDVLRVWTHGAQTVDPAKSGTITNVQRLSGKKVKIETAAWSHEAEANSSDAADQVYSFYDGWTRAPGNGSKSDLTAYLGQTPVDSGSTWEVQSSGHKWAIVIAIELKDRTG